GRGGTASATVNITVAFVNHAPAGTDGLVTTAEDTVLTITAASFGFSDPNDVSPNALAGVRITTLPAIGSLRRNGVLVTAGLEISAADLAANLLKFTPVAEGSGNPYAA